MRDVKDLKLASTVSFRHLGEFAVLIDHRSGRILRLSAAAGRLLAALEAGGTPPADDATRAFLEQLEARKLLDVAEADPVDIDQAAAKTPGGVLERINADAAAARIPLNVQFEVTFRCGLACRHCYLPPSARTSGDDELSLAEIELMLDRLADLGSLFILLTGGEPFARPDFVDIFDAARDRRFAVSILTSGLGADAAIIERMAARGLDAIQVSIHGPDAATHDGFTGVPGSFAAALACLRRCRELGIRTRAGVTVTSSNVGSLGSIRNLLDGEGILAALGLYLEPRRDGHRGPTALAIDEDGVRRAFEIFPPVAAARMARLDARDSPCRAGASVLAIDPCGAVLPCLALRTEAGSLRQRDLADIWRDSPVLHRLRDLSVADLDDCPGCEHREFCDRCAGFAVSEGFSPLGHVPFDCMQARIRHEIEAANSEEK